MNEGSSIKVGAQTSSSEKLIAGSKQCPYKLAVIGGGPSGCSIIIRAFRIGFGGELCGFCTRKPAVDKDGLNIIANAEFPFQSAGVVLVDEGKPEKFGGGKLQDYIINANTWANKFVTNVMDDKPDVLPQESMSNTPFQRLNSASTAVTLKGFGCKPAPLQMVGAFLRDAGSVVQEVLNTKYPDSSRCMLETSVTCLQQVMLPVPDQFRNAPTPTAPEGEGTIEQLRDMGSCVGWKLSLSQKSASAPNGKLVREIYAHKVVLATGGRQELPRLPNPAHTRKLMSSDYICTQKGMDDLRSRLVKAGVTANRTTPGRVVIIGGSHSAFSAAWLCLHRLSDTTINSGSGGTSQSLPVNSSDSKTSAAGVAAESKGSDESQLAFCQSGICMVHKSSIKVFYCTKGDADRDGYVVEGLAPASSSSGGLGAAPGSAAKASSQVSKSWIRGQVHPFGGLRGDAKELWRAARDGRETRLKLIQVRQNVATVSGAATGLGSNCQPLKQQAIVEKLFEEAVVIVWACGYSSNLSMPVLDLSGSPVAMRIKGGQVEVDDHARIISASATASGVVTAAPVLPVPPSPAPTAAALSGLLLPSTLECVSTEVVLVDDGVEETKAAVIDPNTGSPLGSPLRTSSKTQTSSRVPDSPSTAVRDDVVVPGTPNALTLSAVASLEVLPTACLSPMPAPLTPAILTASPSLPLRTSSLVVKTIQPPAPVIEGLLGSGLGFGLQALLETGMPDGSSGRADGVAVYLKRGATLVLAQVLGNRVFGGPDIKSWEDRLRLIKKIQLVANAAKNSDSASATIGPSGLSSSLDSGSSLLTSPSNRRPSTTAGMRNSFSFGSPSSKESSARTGGSSSNNVLKRAIASRETPVAGEKVPVSSAKTSTSAASWKASTGSIPFPLVVHDATAIRTSAPEQQKNDTTVGSPHRPSTAAVPVSANSSRNKGSQQPTALETGGLASPQSKIQAIKFSPEALRCAELVDKVALLSQDCEQLQLQRAKEFLNIPAECRATDATLIVAKPVVSVSADATKRAQSPQAAHPAAASAKPPIPVRGASNSRSGARTRILPEKPHSNTLLGVPKPTVHARVVLTPLDGGSARSGTGSTPRRNRDNSLSSNSSSSSTPRKARAPPARPQSTVNTTVVAVTAGGTGVAAVLRSNSLGGSGSGAASTSLVVAASPRNLANTTKPTGISAALNKNTSTTTSSTSNKKQPNKSGATSPIQPKTMRLELPSIPLHKRSQNQNDDPASRGRATGSIAKEPNVLLAEKLFKPSTGTVSTAGNSTKIVV